MPPIIIMDTKFKCSNLPWQDNHNSQETEKKLYPLFKTCIFFYRRCRSKSITVIKKDGVNSKTRLSKLITLTKAPSNKNKNVSNSLNKLNKNERRPKKTCAKQNKHRNNMIGWKKNKSYFLLATWKKSWAYLKMEGWIHEHNEMHHH